MNFDEFERKFKNNLIKINLQLNNEQIKQFYDYMNLLLEWNEKINLTAIVDPEEIIIKHFIDSLTVKDYIEDSSNIVDVGTGAGFPGIPIKIAFPNTKIVLLDSLNKRINFLNIVINKLNLKNIITKHCRVEDFGRDVKFREKFDYAISRAVAPMNILLEYLVPLIKINGKCICMKSNKINEELENSKNAIKELNVKLVTEKEFVLPNTDIRRTIVVFNKIKETHKKYPRKAGEPSKKPL